MITLNKRHFLIALAALSASGANAALGQAVCTPLDLSAGRDIGASWRAANPDADLSALRMELLPNGACEEALAMLSARVGTDFRSGRIFIYRGWRLSQTEAQLFAIA